MSLPLLAENVTNIVITPFLGLELMPQHYRDWARKTNNNWIRVENEIQSLTEELEVVRKMTEDAVINVRQDITVIRSEVQNEAILRSQADAFLQGQIDAIPVNLSLTVRFEAIILAGGSATVFNHNLGVIPRITIIQLIGTGGIDVTYYFDTLITHNSENQVAVTVANGGLYTIICNT